MSKQKNQHFVPRCYLKPFSFQQAGKAINLFSIHNNRAIQNAAVKKQCSKNFFYGKDLKLENALSKIEAMYATVIKKLCQKEALTKGDMYLLKSFALLQHLRTEQSTYIYKQQHQQFLDTILLGPSTERINFPLSHEEIITISMKMFGDCLPFIEDLDACICDTLGKNQFITSDDPSILTNKFNAQKLKQNGFGLGSSGILFSLPLTPQYLLLVYDPNIYFIECKNHHCIVNGKDVEALNELQFIRAEKNIYFFDWNMHSTFLNKLSKYRKNRPEHWSSTTMYMMDTKNKNKNYTRYIVGNNRELKESRRSLIETRPIHIYPTKWPSVLQYKMHPIAWANGSSVGYVRPEIAKKRISPT